MTPAKSFSGLARLPASCTLGTCEIEVYWGPDDTQTNMNFRLRAKNAGWVAIGFGSQPQMVSFAPLLF
jgi:hypothetical protein